MPQDTVVRKIQAMHALNVHPILGAESQPTQKMAPQRDFWCNAGLDIGLVLLKERLAARRKGLGRLDLH